MLVQDLVLLRLQLRVMLHQWQVLVGQHLVLDQQALVAQAPACLGQQAGPGKMVAG